MSGSFLSPRVREGPALCVLFYIIESELFLVKTNRRVNETRIEYNIHPTL